MAVRALSRGLRILQRLSTTDGLSINETARQLQLARGTAYRLLKTLEADGFVRLHETDNRYRLTRFASTLNQTADWEGWVGDVALPRMEEFTRRAYHPLVLGTLHGTQMISRASTDKLSPLALRHYSRGFIASIPGSSIGLAYIAHCSNELRKLLISELEHTKLRPHARLTFESIDQQIALTRQRGYAVSPIVFEGESAIAVPVIANDELLGAIGLRYIAGAQSETEICKRFLSDLKNLAEAIGHEVEQYGGPPPLLN